jgi:hypothetical protein
MEREWAFTRDLWYCREVFSRYYPEYKERMKKLL